MVAMTLIAEGERTCLRCGYDLRAMVERRCPECGLPFDPDAPPPPAVPWSRRNQIGFLRAYYGTVLLVVAHPRTFAEQAWRRTMLDWDEGESFRRTTVVLAALCIGVGLALAMAASVRRPVEPRVLLTAFANATPGILTFLWIATLRVTVPLPRPRPAGVKQRFDHLQRFCCAGLGLAPVVPLATAFGTMLQWFRLGGVDLSAGMFLVSLAGVLVAWMSGCTMYLFFAGRVGAGGVISAAIQSIVLWAVAFMVAVVVVVAVALIVP